MEPITYHMKESRFHSVWSYMLTFWIAGVIALLIWAVFGELQIDLTFLIVIGLTLSIYIPWTVRVVRHSSKAENFLRLDDDGLTLGSWGQIHQWAWLDLSSFEIRGIEKIGFLTADRYIYMPSAKSGKSGIRRFLQRWGLSPIRDHYDTPLEEIAAALNTYRDRALGGGDATDGPQAPEPA